MVDALDEILTHLQEDPNAINSPAFGDLIRVDESARRELLTRVDAGLQLPGSVASVLAIIDPYKKIVGELWPDETVFNRDDIFTITRLIFLLGQTHGTSVSDARWTAAKSQLRRMLTLGAISSLRGSLFLANQAMDRGDSDFAVYFGAHTHLGETGWMMTASRISSNRSEYAAKLWPRVLLERERLGREVWLRGYVSEQEYRQAQDLVPEMLHALYPQVWADGYAGFAAAVAARA